MATSATTEQAAAAARRLFEALKVLRDMIQKGDMTDSQVADWLQTLIWELGHDLGEF